MFELDGQPLTLEELQGFAKDNNIDFDAYMANMKKAGMVEKQIDSPPPIVESSAVSVLDDGGLDLPEGEFDLSQLYEDEEEGVIRPQKFSHIQPYEFEKLSSAGWWGREGKIVDALKEQYEFDLKGNKSGIQFKTANTGGVDLWLGQDKEANAVEVVLPGQDKGKVFNLYHSDNKAKMQAEYAKITEYIESQKRKSIKPEFKEKIYNVFDSRKTHDEDGKYIDYETRLAMNPNIKDDSVNPFYADEDVASDLSLILGDADVEVNEETIFTNAVSLKLPSGAKQTFNLGAKDVADRMIHFLESDPRGYKQTKKYKEEVVELDKVIEPYLKGYKEDPEKGLLLTGGNAKALKTKIMNDLGSAGWQQAFFADKETLQNLTEDEKINLIGQRIQAVVDNASGIKGRVDARQAILDLKESGEAVNDKEIYEVIEKQVSKSFGDENSLQNQIFKLNLELYSDDITPERRDVILGNKKAVDKNFLTLPQLRHLLEEEESSIWTEDEGKNYFINPVTLEKSLSTTTEEDVAYEPINITDGVNDQAQKLKDEKLTIKQLKNRWTFGHLSHNQFMDDWSDKKRKFFIDPDKRQGFLERFPDTSIDNDGKTVATDEFARTHKYWFDPGKDANHIARMEYGINLQTKVDALDKMYAMNEDIKSQKQAGFWASTVESVVQSFTDKSYEFKYGVPSDQFRQTFLSEMEGMRIQPTAADKEYAKSTTPEITGTAVGIVPKIGIDFWLANKAIGIMGAATGLNRLLTGTRGLGGLKGRHFEVGGKTLTREQLVSHITATNSKWFTRTTTPLLVEGGVYGQKVPKLIKMTPGSPAHETQIAKWIRANKKQLKIKDVAPPISSRIKSHAIGANLEGIKMEIAMQDPSGAILSTVGLPSWREESELSEWGESYATGVGFYAANFIPLHKLANKSSAWKGMFDKFVAAPINFTMASKLGGFVNAAVEDMKGSTTWGAFLEEEYGDYDEMMKHIISDLAMGVSMSLHKVNRFDSPFFITGGKGKRRIIMGGEEGIEKLKRAASIKRRALFEKYDKNVYEKDKDGNKVLVHKKGDVIFEIDADGNRQVKLKKGVKQEDVEKHSILISMANERLALIKDTKEYLDPVLGPLKLLKEHDGAFEAMRKAGKDVEPQYHYDLNQSQRMSHRVVKSGETLRNGKKNETGKEVHEMVFNPKLITPGLAPHELGHVGFHVLFGEDVLLKSKFVNGVIEIAKKAPMPDSDLTLYDTLVERGVWKEGNKYTMAKVKEWELFSYVAEFLKDGNTMKKIREQYGLPVENNVFDRLANLLQTNTKEKLKVDSNFDTQKDIVEWFDKYIETIGKGEGFVGQMKHLEKWISRTKTENQRKRREAGEGFIEESMRSEVLERLENQKTDLKEQLKGNPFLQQFLDKEITKDQYKEKTEVLRDKIEKVENQIKDISTRYKEQDVLATEDGDVKFQNELQEMYENPINVKGAKITSKSDKAYFIAEKYNPINNSNPGAAVLASKLKMFDNRKRPNFKLNRELIIEDVTVGGVPKPKMKGEGFKKDRSIRQLILEYDPSAKDTNKKLPDGKPNPNYGKQIPLTGYIGKAMWGPKGSVGKGRGVKESVDYFAPEVTTGKVVKGKEAIEAKTVVYGDMKAKVELPISETQFEGKEGWRETIERRAQRMSGRLTEAGYKDLPGLTPELIQKMFNVKLSESQKKNINDLGETNLENLQKIVNSKFVVEEVVGKDGIPKEREVLVVESIKDLLSNGTVETAAAVTERLRGTATGTPNSMLHPDAKLYHLATPKNYTEAELLDLNFDVGKTPAKDKKTGEEYWRVTTPAGGRIFIKGPAKGEEIKNEDILRYIGVENTYKDGKIVSTKYTPLEPSKGGNRALAGHGRRLMDAMDQVITNQVVREGVIDGIITVPGARIANVLFNLGSGRSRKIFSQVLEKELELDQKREFFKGINSSEFSYLYNDYLSKTKINPLGKALRDYFTSLGSESAFDINNIKQTREQMIKIGKQLEKKLGIEGVTSKVKALRVRVAAKLLKPQDLNAIEKDLGLEQTDVKWLFDAGVNGGIHLARSLDATLLEIFEKKKGKGWYEAVMLLGNTTGTGIGGKRKAIYETADDARKLADQIKTSKIYKEISRADSNRQGIKKDLMKYVGFLAGGGKFNKANIKKAYDHGEINKKNLKEIIEEVKKLRDKDDIDHRHVRAFLEVAGGPMEGILRKSASLAIIPKGTPKELFEIWPEKVFNKKNGKWESGWVLEHTIPTQYVKARIYEYILSGTKEAKVAMDLTLRDFHTTFIPKQLDVMVNKLYLSELPPEFLPGMDPLEWRYYRNAYPSDFNIALEKVHGEGKRTYDLNPNFTQTQVQARARVLKATHIKLFGDIGLKRAVINRFNSENLISAAKIDKALANGRSIDKKKKGMSTWDFDDTLARTKSGVRYTLPNPSGKPAPGRKVIFLAGGAGSGKSNVVKQLGLEKQGFKIVNQDISLEWLAKNSGLPADMREFTPEQASKWGSLQWEARDIAQRKQMKFQGKGDGIIVDGTGASSVSMSAQVRKFRSAGYDVQMMFVETSLDVALARNKARKERSLKDFIVERNHKAVMKNKKGFKELFGERFAEVNTDNLKVGDAMPSELIEKLDAFTKGYIKARLNAGEFADKGAELKEQGAEFDFAEFDIVKEGKPGPLFQQALIRAKKYGTKDQFILTARPPEAAPHIQEFLKSIGLDIPLENITGLGNSTSEAKALWMLEKFGEGYNDMYFADDAIQNVKAVKNVLSQLDIKFRVVQAKAQEQKSLNDIKDVNRLDSPDTFAKILYSRNLRSEYEKTIAKHRPDLVKERLVSKTVDEMFTFIDTLDVPANKKKKYEQITTKWLATSNIKLKEDAYKVKQAVEIAERYKEDIFSYRNPNEIIEKYAGKIKEKPTDPKTVKEFRSSGEYKKRGITIYNVENTKEGQQSVRGVIDSHWGKNSNPWCITQTKNGKLTEDAWHNWTAYEKGPKRIIFQDGKLSSFYANGQYWGRMDNATDAPVITVKDGRVTKKVELVPIGEGKVEEFVRETRTVSKDKKTVTTDILEESQDGYDAGTKIVENRVNGITIKETHYNPEGKMILVKEFGKDGKATASYNFFPDGKMSSVNTYGKPFGDMLDIEVIRKKGDMLEHVVNENDVAYMHGRIKIGDAIHEIGWTLKEKNSDLKNVIKTVDGKVRIDLKKVLEIDPDAKGIPKEVLPKDRAYTPATRMFSENLSADINDIMEHSLGIESKKRFSIAEGKIRGADKKRRKFFIPDSAADLELLIEPLYGKGKKGIENQKWFKKEFLKPWERGINDLHTTRQTTLNDYMSLRKNNKDVVKMLDEPTTDTNFTNDMAMRVYLWNKAGFEVPGLTKTSKAKLLEYMANNPKLQAYAENVAKLTKVETGLIQPKETWWAETLASEISEIGKTVNRDKHIGDWIEIKNEIFSKENLNKMESELGPKWREAMESILWRMETGKMRGKNLGRVGNAVMDYLNGSVGVIMNLNTRSATLQLISTVNFINHAENNPLAAAKAFGNQPQYWKDFMKIMNSDMLKQRRDGLQINVTEAELAAAAHGKGNKAKKALAWILKQGYIPTKVADSFAISAGGATYFRNRTKMYQKEGFSLKEAESKAWLDFQAIAERTQQSSRPDLLSQSQVSFEGRLLLPFANTPMQMNRIGMKEQLDIAKGRYDGWFGENSFTHKMSKISYYYGIQSAIFAGLQTGLFALMANSDDKDQIAQKKVRAYNTMADSFLRGMGIPGVVASGIKNASFKFYEQNKKGFTADYSEVGEALLNMSPTIGSKFSKMDQAGNTYSYNKKEILEKGLSLDNTKGIEASAQVVEAITNVPVARVIRKTENIQAALDEQNENWQRIMNLLGWSEWDVGAADYQKKKEKEGNGKPKDRKTYKRKTYKRK